MKIKGQTQEFSIKKAAYVRACGYTTQKSGVNYFGDCDYAKVRGGLREMIVSFFQELAEEFNAAAGKEACKVMSGYVVKSCRDISSCFAGESMPYGEEFIGDLRINTLVRNQKSLSLTWDGETGELLNVIGLAHTALFGETQVFTGTDIEELRTWWYKGLPNKRQN